MPVQKVSFSKKYLGHVLGHKLGHGILSVESGPRLPPPPPSLPPLSPLQQSMEGTNSIAFLPLCSVSLSLSLSLSRKTLSSFVANSSRSLPPLHSPDRRPRLRPPASPYYSSLGLPLWAEDFAVATSAGQWITNVTILHLPDTYII